MYFKILGTTTFKALLNPQINLSNYLLSQKPLISITLKKLTYHHISNE